jgi:hypothetical protein
LFGDDPLKAFEVFAPRSGQRNVEELAKQDLVDKLLALDVLPSTGAEAAAVLKCRRTDALAALKEAREHRPEPRVPGSRPLYREPGTLASQAELL